MRAEQRLERVERIGERRLVEMAVAAMSVAIAATVLKRGKLVHTIPLSVTVHWSAKGDGWFKMVVEN